MVATYKLKIAHVEQELNQINCRFKDISIPTLKIASSVKSWLNVRIVKLEVSIENKTF